MTTSANTLLLSRTAETSFASTILLTKGAVNFLNQDRLIRQWVGPPLAAQTITGTVKGRMMCSESTATGDIRSQLLIQACNSAATAFTGTLYAGDLTTLTGSPTSEWNLTTKMNRQMPRGASVALSSLAVNEGDRLVVSAGYRVHSTSVANFSGAIVFGDDGASDLPEDETETDETLRSWIEFSQTLLFADERCRTLATWED